MDCLSASAGASLDWEESEPVDVASVASEFSSMSIDDGTSKLALGCSANNSTAFAPSWICAICLDKIKVEETAQIKGCEHAYCANCILRWASYKENPWCPQCKLPFSSLFVCKKLDGRPSDYMLEESVCLLLRASWFKPLPAVQETEEAEEYHYQDEDELYEEYYYTSNVRLGNRRWGDSGYVRGGRKEARPIGVRHIPGEGSASSGGSGGANEKGKEIVKENVGRRAKRAQKRVEADLKLKQKI